MSTDTPWKDSGQTEPTTPAAYDGRCPRCGDLGFWLTPMGIVTECPNLQLALNDHPTLNAAAEKVLLSGRWLREQKLVANPLSFDVARSLVEHTVAAPCERNELARRHFGYSKKTIKREIALVIEDLRTNWLLPVASSKRPPHGYWIAVTQAEFAAWVGRASSAPRTQLTSIFRLAKRHWPVYGEQLELDIWRDMEPAPVGIELPTAHEIPAK